MIQIKDWNKRWKNNRIGFHEGKTNSYLKSQIDQFNLPKEATIFMPLCGKSVDMAWLAKQGFNVIGVECSEIAILDFFKENQIDYTLESDSTFNIYKSHRITIYQGDFFALSQQHFKQCDLIFDRASMIAIDPDQRDKYVSHLKTWFSIETKMLLIILTYDQNLMSGPPFSVPKEDILKFYKDRQILEIESKDLIETYPKRKALGLTEFFETAFNIS